MPTKTPRLVRRQLFPEKLWDLVHNTDSGIDWSADGTCIEVERTLLEKSIGAKFRSQNFDSFIRQLHFYGFRKAGNSYYHEKFQQNQLEQVLTMKRKYSNAALTPISDNANVATMVNAMSQTSNGSGGGSDQNNGARATAEDPLTPVIKQRKVANKTPKIVHSSSINRTNVEGVLDLRKSSRTNYAPITEDISVTNTHDHSTHDLKAIDYSKSNKLRRLLPGTVRSPSKTLSKTQQNFVVKVGL